MAKWNIKIEKTSKSRLPGLDIDNLPFGEVCSDHMFTVDYEDGEWKNPQINPYGDIALSPSLASLHYGQAIFEGMKAFKNNGEVFLFRPEENAKRLNKSAVRMCMPELPVELFLEGLNSVLAIDSGWIPPAEGRSLYIRPFMIAADAYLGVRPSHKYKFMIITSPVGPIYPKPVKVKVERQFTRAAHGGVGAAKAAGNYGSALYPTKLAEEQGYNQLIWTDAVEHKYIEESGTMNIVFRIGDKLITPALTDTILPGITRDSILTIARDLGYIVEERKVSIEEIVAAHKNGTLKEAFGVGTAASISKIATIGTEEAEIVLNPDKFDYAHAILQQLNNIRLGVATDKFNWVKKVGTLLAAEV